MTNNKLVLGLFYDRSDAENVISDFEGAGFNPKDISIVMKDPKEAEYLAHDTGASSVASGAVEGATTGAVVGGLAGLVAAFAIPGLGAFLIGGPLAAALGLSGAAATTASGIATGALAGGLIGALTKLGVSEEDARHYHERVREGAILLAVPAASTMVADVQAIMEEHGASDIREFDVSDFSSRSDVLSADKPQFGFAGGEARTKRSTTDDDLDDDLV